MASSSNDLGAPGARKTTPLNLLHVALFHADPTMLSSADGKRIEINLDAIRRVLDGEVMSEMLRPFRGAAARAEGEAL